MENLSEVIYTTDDKGVVTYVSPNIEEIAGYHPDEIIGRHFTEFIHPDDLPERMNHFQKALNGDSVATEYRYVTKKGVLWVRTKAKPLTKNDRVIGISGTLIDITDLKEVEESLRESEREYRFLAEKMSDVVFTLDMDLRTTYVSPSIQRVLGYTPEERMNQDIHEQLTPESLSVVKETMARELAIEREGTGDPDRAVKLEVEYYHKDGSTRWHEVVVSGIRDVDGVLTGFHGVSRDITTRKRVEEEWRESESRFLDVMHASRDAIAVIGENNRFVDCNESAAKMHGYSTREDILMCHPGELSPPRQPDGRDSIEKADEMIRLASEKGYHRFEWMHRKRNGEDFWSEVSLTPIFYEGKRLLYAIWRDITELKQAEEVLRQSEEKFRLIFYNTPDSICINRLKDGAYLEVNKWFTVYSGFMPEEVIGKTPRQINIWADPADIKKLLKYLKEKGVVSNLEARFRTKEGAIRTCLMSAAIVNVQGEPCILSISRDITHLKELEVQIERERNRAQMYLDIAGVMLLVLDVDGKISLINKKGGEVLGYDDPKELIGVDWFEKCLPEKVKDEVRGVFDQIIRGKIKPVEYYENPVCTKSGAERLMSFHNTFLYDESGRITGVLSSGEDITERVRAEEALRKSERELKIRNEISRLFLTAPEGEVYGKVLSLILEATKSGSGLFGYIDERGNLVCPSLIRSRGENFQEIGRNVVFPREKWPDTWGRPLLKKKTFLSNEPLYVVETHVLINRAIFVPMVYGDKLVGCLGLANKEIPYDEEDRALVETIADHIAPILHARLERDREQRKREKVEGQLHQSQKLESIGRLAGGVAHDFNNILNIIMGYGEITLLQLNQEDPRRKNIEHIVEAANRAANLTRQLLAFSRRQTIQPKVVDLNDLIVNLEKMLRRLIGEDIELKLNLTKESIPIYADPGQIEQVIMNLVVNARDAMPEGGSLLLETALTELDEADVGTHPGLKAGKYALLAITDTGCGMDEETLAQIYEPFFTTKEKGHGTGLGLSMVYGIVKQTGGYISCYSELGKGTTFKIYLPLTEGGPQKVNAKPKATSERGRGEHILVVEDEEGLLGLMKDALTQMGYKVTVAANGDETLMLVEEKGLKPDLVITDVVMPHMNGKEMVERLRRKHPQLKVIYMSGYTEKLSNTWIWLISILSFSRSRLPFTN